MIELSSLPKHIETPAGWIGQGFVQRTGHWRWTLSAEQISDLIESAHSVSDKQIPPEEITRENFPIPSLEAELSSLRRALIHGIGFQVIRGIPVDEIGVTMASTIFFGIGAHLGVAKPQNAAGDLLGHVRDTGADSIDPNTRIYQTNERQTFHTDSTDVVGLLCLKEAREGGHSLLVSAVTIYNRIRRISPDLLLLLFDKIATDRRGEVPKGAQPFFKIPVFSWYRGFLTVMYQRQYIDSAQRFEEAPRLSPKHIEALDLFDKMANDPELHLSMRLRPGDMQFVYNHHLLHDRVAFTDWPEPEKRRHLLRLWLSVPGDRPLPAYFAERYGSVEIGIRGGVNIKP